jgi:hypothetical protein
MKRTLAIVLLLLCGLFSFAQKIGDSLFAPLRSTKSYLITDYNEKDMAFLKEKCSQAGLDLGLSVVANRIPTDSKLVAPKPSQHLLKQGVLDLQSALDEKQTVFAVYRSELLEKPSSINVLQIEDELVVYRTTEASGSFHILYQCTRGAFGTKAAAHPKNAPAYKLWDTPDRTLLPDLEMQNQIALFEAKVLANTDVQLLIFNDLESYGYSQGDEAIGRFLDTMHKYNPDKLLQADLLTPMSWRYLSRINENQLWNESMRNKIVETLAEKQAFYRRSLMPWMIGNFQILLADKNRKATTLEELEWFLSKAAAFEGGFGLICSAETMRKHGLTDEMLNTIADWETLRMAEAFSDAQKEAFKDPYGNWHLEKGDSTYLLYSQHVSRRYFCNLTDDRWEWNSPFKSRFALRIMVEGKGSISELEFRTPNGILYIPCTLKAGQCLIYDFDGSAFVTDLNYNKIQDVEPQGISFLDEGISEVTFTCEVKPDDRKTPEVTVRFMTRGAAEEIGIP